MTKTQTDGYRFIIEGLRKTFIREFEFRDWIKHLHYAIHPFIEMNTELKEAPYIFFPHKT